MLKTARSTRTSAISNRTATIAVAAVALLSCLWLLLMGGVGTGWQMIVAGCAGMAMLVYEALRRNTRRDMRRRPRYPVAVGRAARRTS